MCAAAVAIKTFVTLFIIGTIYQASNIYIVWIFFVLLQWSTWGSLFGVNPSSTAGLYVLEYLIYVLIAIFFAWISAIAVKVFAPYACGSGIPEVCNQVKDVFKLSFSGYFQFSWCTNSTSNLCSRNVYNIESWCFVMVLSHVSVISNGVSNVSIFWCCCGVVLSSWWRRQSFITFIQLPAVYNIMTEIRTSKPGRLLYLLYLPWLITVISMFAFR